MLKPIALKFPLSIFAEAIVCVALITLMRLIVPFVPRLCQPDWLPAPVTCTAMFAYVMYTAVTPFGTVGGSVIKTAKVPDDPEFVVENRVLPRVVAEPSTPVPKAIPITATAISAAIVPETSALFLFEFMVWSRFCHFY